MRIISGIKRDIESVYNGTDLQGAQVPKLVGLESSECTTEWQVENDTSYSLVPLAVGAQQRRGSGVENGHTGCLGITTVMPVAEVRHAHVAVMQILGPWCRLVGMATTSSSRWRWQGIALAAGRLAVTATSLVCGT